jgi:2-phosphoglycerate kinase
MCNIRVILIGGSSNVGKSTLAEYLSIKLEGWCCISTDSLARHPGRPWSKIKEVPKHVIEHYSSRSVEELLEDVLRHYRNMQPAIASLIMTHATNDSIAPLILEGSALLPEFVSTLNLDNPNLDNIAAIWLTASENLFRKRIYDASQFEKAAIAEKSIIQKFLGRTLSYNRQMMEAIVRLGLVSVNVESASSLDELTHLCLNFLKLQI